MPAKLTKERCPPPSVFLQPFIFRDVGAIRRIVFAPFHRGVPHPGPYIILWVIYSVVLVMTAAGECCGRKTPDGKSYRPWRTDPDGVSLIHIQQLIGTLPDDVDIVSAYPGLC